MKRVCAILLAVMFVLAFIYCQKTLAMPPHPDRVEEMAALKAFGEPYIDFDSLAEVWRSRGIDSPGDMDMSSLLATSDTVNILAILIQFPDKSSQTNAEYFDTLIYSNQQGCVTHYYLENSYGTLHIGTLTLPSEFGWLTSAENASYYTSGGDYGLGSYPNNAQKLVEEAVDLADPLVDFSLYDNDDNGYVDGLMVVHAGRGAEYTMNASDIWSHKWGISPRSKDGVYVSTYSMMPEYFTLAGDMTCGVYVHELGHVFGLPDLYDRDYSSRGIGNWTVMAGGSWNGVNGSSPAHFDAWCKVQLGFVTAANVASTQMGVSIPQVETNATVYRLWTNGDTGTQYFLVENRQKTGYDNYLPSEGLLVYHIDDTQDDGSGSPDNDNEWYPPSHTSSGNYLVALEQADGLWQLEQKLSSGDSGDPFPGSTVNRNFSPLTTPNSNDYNDDNTLVAITNISDSGPNMSADFTVSFASSAEDEIEIEDEVLPEEFELAQNYPNPFNAETKISFSLSEPGEVSLEVYNVIGQKVRTLTSEIYEPGNYEIHWDGLSESGQPAASGLYFYRLETIEGAICKKMLLMK
ncbi:MAG: M6 family metalloprotease domain-containing protein [candidate division Zixibacteria bacterium]|nr:M6 family metalloprotease domain-containing protein [candidate division Zixibacteria bacterium]